MNKIKKVSIIIPVYNEEKNVKVLLDELDYFLKNALDPQPVNTHSQGSTLVPLVPRYRAPTVSAPAQASE